MAITLDTLREDYAGRSAELDQDGIRTAERRFLVKLAGVMAADPAERDAIEATVESSLPVSLYDPHPAYPEAIARTVKLSPNGSHDEWVATVGYSSAPFAASGDGSGGSASGTGGGASSPAAGNNNSTAADARPPEIRTMRREYTEVLERDAVVKDSNDEFVPVVNTVGDPFDPPLETSRSRITYEFVFWRSPAALAWDTRSDLMDHVNESSATFLGKTHAAKTLLIRDVSHQGVWDKGSGGSLTFFWKITALVEYKRDTWMRKPLNAGRRKKVSGVVVDIVDPQTGLRIADPVPLAENGTIANPLAGTGLPGGYFYPAFNEFPTCDFSDLFA